MSEDFDLWADLYRTWTDLTPDEDIDIPFYARLAAEAGGPVVDLGIGVGRVAAVVKPTVGVDVSAAMLAETRRRLGDGIVLHQASIADYDLDEPASLQYAAQNTLNHVPDEARAHVFHAVFATTQPGGRFAFDTALPQADSLKRRDRIPTVQAMGDAVVVHDIVTLLDEQGRRARLSGIIEQLDGQRRVVERRYFPGIVFTFLTVPEVTRWATDAGWHIESVHQDFSGTELGPDAKSAVWCLRRPVESTIQSSGR